MYELTIFYNYSLLLFIFNLFIRYKNIKIYNEFINLNQSIMKIILFSYTLIYNKNTYSVITFNIFDYSLNNLIFIYDKNYDLLLHHCITSLFLLSSQFYNLHKISVKILLLFTYSSPILSIAKICKYKNYTRLSNYFFIFFTFTFIYYRIILFSYYIYLYLNYYNYYSMSLSIIIIYILQYFWLFKIIKIINKKK